MMAGLKFSLSVMIGAVIAERRGATAISRYGGVWQTDFFSFQFRYYIVSCGFEYTLCLFTKLFLKRQLGAKHITYEFRILHFSIIWEILPIFLTIICIILIN